MNSKVVTFGDWVRARKEQGKPVESPRISVYSCQCESCNRWWVQTQVRVEPCPFCGSSKTTTHRAA